jgi:hypothetical protein
MKELYQSLLKVQSELTAIKKDEKNPYFNSTYVSLNAVRDGVVGILTKNDLVLLQPTKVIDGKQYVVTTIVHAGTGASVEAQTEVVSKNGQDAQQVGSGISYARRYGLMSLLCLAAEDDDGNSATGKVSTKTEATTTAATPVASAPKKVSFAKKTTAAPVVATTNTGDEL